MRCDMHLLIIFIVSSVNLSCIKSEDKPSVLVAPENGPGLHRKDVIDIEALEEDDIVPHHRLDLTHGHRRSRRSAIRDRSKLWKNGIVYYEIEDSFKPLSKKMLARVIKEYEARTCLRFVKRTNQRDYVVFSSIRRGCSSAVGRVGGPQWINLSRRCRTLGRFEHEIMHALGFVHEQSRPDRDDYIKLEYKNIKEDYWKNFKKYSLSYIDDMGETFDFSSIMLYRNRAFSKNGKDTIIPLKDPKLKFGQRYQFSVGDIRKVNKLYRCSKYLKQPNYKGLVEENHGYRGGKSMIQWHK